MDTETILPGVTRASIIELAKRECNCEVIEQRLTISHLRHGDPCEAFCCGTGASITPVGSVTVLEEDDGADGASKGSIIKFGDGLTPGPLTQRLYKMLLDLQTGVDEELNEKYKDWIHVVEP